MSIRVKCQGLIPVRFLTLLCHLTMLILMSYNRTENVEACMPLHYTQEEIREKDFGLAVGIYSAIAILAFELSGFLSGASMFITTSCLVSIGAHFSGTLGLAFFIFDKWDCNLFWWLFTWCATVPALVEMFCIFGILLAKS